MKACINKIAALFLAGQLIGSDALAQAGIGPAPYCMPAYSNIPCNQPNPSNTVGNFINDFIDNFSTAGAVANITNNNTGCQSQFLSGVQQNYFYKACPTFMRVNPGQAITVTKKSGITYDQGFAVYIDWNNNGVFAFPGEQVCATPGVPLAATPTSMVFNVPAAQPAGTYRMRARSAYFTTGTTIDPCLLYGFGETEDYNVVVGAGVCTILPIELVSLDASAKEFGVEVAWITATEHNSDHFTLERSYDDEHFEMLGTIPASGNSYNEKLYLANDYKAKKNSLIYYRLKEFDKGEKEPKMEKVITYYGKEVNLSFDLFPNPSNNEIKLQMPELLSGKNITLEVFNTAGRNVIKYDHTIDAMNSPVEMNIANLDNGTYYIRVSDDEGTVMKKMLIKQ